jgi:L-rhamnose-H+ transport protein
MGANPVLGVFFHWLGGLASASFYVPYRGVRNWSWPVFWLVGGVFSWILAPWLFALIKTENLGAVLDAAPARTLFLCYLFGALWGLGGLTFGLTLRYLGMSLGMAVALGLTAAFGTLIPPLVSGELITLAGTNHGLVILGGVALCLVGIAIVGWAGRLKEGDGVEQQGVAEFNFRRGILIALFSGIMSSCFAYGLAAGEPIRQLTLAQGTDPLSQGLPVLVVVLSGGFTTNFLWCLYLILRDGCLPEFAGRQGPTATAPPPLLRNYALCALAGIAWYLQFFFYTMGESQMGRFGFSSWTLHMASIIIFATLWGFMLREWAGSSRRTRAVLGLGIAVLVLSTCVIGGGNYLGTLS